jgi:hypothetical protein
VGAANSKEDCLETIKLFVGMDDREAVGLHVFCQSVWKHTSVPVEIVALTPKLGRELGIVTDGSNNFTKLRYAVAALCDFRGWACFADGADMLVRSDLAELWRMREAWYAVQCVKHEYEPTPTKYVGTELEGPNTAYPRKNWSSLFLMDCGHYMNRVLTYKFIAQQSGQYLHRFSWLPDERIGEIPKEWNYIVGEQNQEGPAKIAHHSLGIPGFKYYAQSEYADEWRDHYVAAIQGLQTEVSER